MDLDKAAKQRLSRYIKAKADEAGSFSRMYREFVTTCTLQGISDVLVSETMRKWAEQRSNSLRAESLEQLAALRGETQGETEAWLLGIEYVPDSVKIEGTTISAQTSEGRELMIRSILANSPAGELLESANMLLSRLAEIMCVSDPVEQAQEPQAEETRLDLAYEPEKSEKWEGVKRLFIVDMATRGHIFTDKAARREYAHLMGLSEELVTAILDNGSYLATCSEIEEANRVLSASNGPNDLLSELVQEPDALQPCNS